MEELFLPSPIYDDGPWFFSGNSTCWTKEENKKFESALAVFDEDTPERWMKVAALIPGKSAWDVENKYRELLEDVSEIEAGRFPIPGYLGPLDWMEGRDFDACRKKPSGGGGGRASDHERKKGVPWTEEEHRRFLMGLLKYGKGDWRSISRNFVISKTPTQVASHAQKYYIRQLSGGKDKRRPSIHDITTMSLTDSSVDNNTTGSLDQQPSVLSTEQKFAVAQGLGMNRHVAKNDGAFIIFESNHANLYTTDAFGIGSINSLKLREDNSLVALRGSMMGIHSTRHQVQG